MRTLRSTKCVSALYVTTQANLTPNYANYTTHLIVYTANLAISWVSYLLPVVEFLCFGISWIYFPLYHTHPSQTDSSVSKCCRKTCFHISARLPLLQYG